MNRRARTLIGTGAATVALALALAVPAFASGPPTGTYDCASGYSLKIKAGHAYKFSVGKGGGYDYKAGTHKLVFTSGYLKKDWYGKFRRDTTNAPIIDLILKDHSGSDSCYK
jgi:hypothetical protein